LELAFGVGPQGILDRSQILGNYYGIIGLENSWLLLLLIFGAIGLVFFVAGLFAWLREMLAGAPPAAYLGAVCYVAIASTNNTLAAKDTSLVHLVILICGARGYAIWSARRIDRPVRLPSF
jgi:hypothetical protein